MEASITKCKVRGKSMWRVRWHDAGRVHRRFFSGRDGADAHAAQIRGDAVSSRKLLAALPQSEQEKLVMLYRESVKRGSDLLDFLATPQTAAGESESLGRVIDEMIVTKRKAGRNSRYLDGIENILNEFAKGQESRSINRIGLADVERYLDGKQLVSRSCYRGRLSTLFNFAVRRGYMASNPCSRLEAVTVTRPPPAILTIDEAKKCLTWLQDHPRMFGWFVLSTFAGLRPEEAEKTTWKDINFAEGWIKVEAQTSKIRQRRVVYPPPAVFKWLKLVKKSKAKLPCNRNTRSNNLERLRAVLGWPKWKHDVTRHSCASYWLSSTGNASAVATALGHTEGMLRKHYMGLCTKADSEIFWSLSAKSV